MIKTNRRQFIQSILALITILIGYKTKPQNIAIGYSSLHETTTGNASWGLPKPILPQREIYINGWTS